MQAPTDGAVRPGRRATPGFPVRRFLIAMLLGATAGLSGCNSPPPDPYSGMQMLTPQEVGAAQQQLDPVLQAEKDHNAKFASKHRRTP